MYCKAASVIFFLDFLESYLSVQMRFLNEIIEDGVQVFPGKG